MEEYKFHDAANEFPLLELKQLEELADDIREHGLREPIMLCEGKILDGRNRYLACQKAGVEPHTQQFNGEDPFAYAWSLNGERRDLTQDQRYLIWKSVTEKSEAWQKQRAEAQREANRKRSEATKKRDRKGDGTLASGATTSGSTGRNPKQKTSTAKAKASKTNRGTVERMDRLVREAPDLAEQVKTGEMAASRAVAQLNRKIKTADLVEAGRIEGRYSVIYADPPWRYEHVKTHSRAIENQYPTMDLSEICALDVPTTDDAILFLWTTAPKLEESLSVVKAWGFVYRSCAIWDKGKIGMGYYFRIQHELLLIATKGNIPTPPESARPPSVIASPKGRHSSKPDALYGMIEAMYPDLGKLEMFARDTRDGWAVWGNEARNA